ncbi:MAG: Rrf2 family transcriptional regulator [Alphaproteobacteria bacterium]
MRLNTKGRYAVMAVVELAIRGENKPVSLIDIAERQSISLSYLEQIFARLRRAKLVRSIRGPGGGYLLAKTPDQVRISDVFSAFDDLPRDGRCSPSIPHACSNRSVRCATHNLWAELGNEMFRAMQSITVADVVNGSGLLAATGENAGSFAAD